MESYNTKDNFSYTDSYAFILVGFKELYPEIINIPTVDELLENIPREQLIKVAQTLSNLYKMKGFRNFQSFFSSSNSILKDDFNRRFYRIYQKNNADAVKGDKIYIFCTMQTITEFLKRGFSIIPKEKTLSNNDFEENILKAILIINDSLNDYTYEQNNDDDLINLAELLLVNSFSQKDINSFDYTVTFKEMLVKSIDLFEYICANDYFQSIYNRFKDNLQIKDYRDYIKTILGLFIIIFQNALQSKEKSQIEQWACKFEYDPNKDVEGLISIPVLNFISIPCNKVIPISENDDYKTFRDKPLIKLPDGSFEIVNVGFLLERMYYSIYFDFKSIVKELKLPIPAFDSEYTEGYGEKYLLCKYIQGINDSNQYLGVSGIEKSRNIKNNDGLPDYYLKKNNETVILFENKFIMINAKIKQSRDFNKIIEAYKNKLLLKTHSNGKEIRNPIPIGIGQLVEHIKKIQGQKFFWDETVSADSTIYPVIVLDDTKLLPDGLAYLMQRWYEDLIKANEINKKNVRPLILMSISTLLFYRDEFSKNGLEYYFEEYNESIRKSLNTSTGKPLTNIVNATITFTEFMSLNFKKSHEDVFQTYQCKLFTTKNNQDNK